MSDLFLAIFIILLIYYFMTMNCGCDDYKYYENFENKIINNQPINLPVKSINPINPPVKSINPIIDNRLKNEARVSDRYNRKYNNIPNENELYNIRKYNFDSLINDEEEDETHLNASNNQNTIYNNSKSIDNKIFNKSNRSQKLYKDSKTIANRFTKNSIIEDYKYELDYYQKQKTPWWEE